MEHRFLTKLSFLSQGEEHNSQMNEESSSDRERADGQGW